MGSNLIWGLDFSESTFLLEYHVDVVVSLHCKMAQKKNELSACYVDVIVMFQNGKKKKTHGMLDAIMTFEDGAVQFCN